MELVLANLCKVYAGGRLALDSVDLNVAPGERIVIVGPSGCGKTTLLRLIAGLEKPNSGRIQIGGRPMNATPPWRRPVGMVFQRPALVSGQTVKESARTVPASAFRSPLDDVRGIDSWLEKFGLKLAANQRVDHLSGGQIQRLALLRTLIRGSPIQLLDEPLGALDTVLRTDLRETLLEEFARQKTTVLWVTHDPEDAWTLADRIAVMTDGRFSQVASPAEIIEHPANRAVLELFQDHWGGVNFVDGRIDGTTLRTAFGPWPLPRRQPPLLEKAGISLGFPVSTLTLPYNGANRDAVPLRMIVERRSLMKSGIRLLCRNDQGRLWAAGNTEFNVGETVTVMIDLERALWFDSQDGKAIAA